MSHPKTAATDHEVLDLIRHRWSPRAFDAAKRVSRADLLRLFEAARWSPSSYNEQPWRFVVTDRFESPDHHAGLAASLIGKNGMWAANAPVLVLVAIRETREIHDSINTHAWYDSGQAVAYLTLQAQSMGLSLRQMQGFDIERAREACAVPQPFVPAVVMAIGYAGDPESLTHDSHRVSEQKPRTRKPMDEIVYWGRWA